MQSNLSTINIGDNESDSGEVCSGLSRYTNLNPNQRSSRHSISDLPLISETREFKLTHHPVWADGRGLMHGKV